MEDDILYQNERATIFRHEFDETALIGTAPEQTQKPLLVVREENPAEELRLFLKNLARAVPLIVPKNAGRIEKAAPPVPGGASFAVCTSGTTGKPKIYFRTLQSWTDFFPIQNSVFSVTNRTRLFMHGKNSFTGNLNIALEIAWTGARIFSSDSMNARRWARVIAENGVNALYLIPNKLLHLCKTNLIFETVETIISGSDLILPKLRAMLARTFPNARLILYYGSSEASYISYKKIDLNADEPYDETSVGSPFDTVSVSISNEKHILVQSAYGVLGASTPIDTKDRGFFRGGTLHFLGRSDDLANISGEKIEKSALAKRLLSVPGIDECAITVEENGAHSYIVANIAGEQLPEKIDAHVFAGLSSVLVPKKIRRFRTLPKNDSGKVHIP